MTGGIRIDELIRSKRKTVSLTITREARLVVRAPLRLSIREIEKMVHTKRSWIISKKKQAMDHLESLGSCNAKSGRHFLFMGRPLKIIVSDTPVVIHEGDTLYIPDRGGDQENELIGSWFKQQAKCILAHRTCQLSDQTGIPFKDVRVTSARRRWGSCNSINRIQLTWRLIMAEKSAMDYVIIHELCHVLHKNHSSAFWSKVEELMPDYKSQREWLKKHAYILDLL